MHALYQGAAAPAIEAAFPGVAPNGVVDRQALGALVFDDPAALRRLEAIIHPLVAAAREAFLAEAAKSGERLVLLDVPLLFEIGAERTVDAVVLVTAPETVQKARAAARPGMTSERLAAILARQMPDAEKRARAHFIIETGLGFAVAERQVRGVLRALAGAADKGASRSED